MGNSKLTPQQRILAFVKLGKALSKPDENLQQLIATSHLYNPWFTASNTAKAVESIALMLDENDLQKWFDEEFSQTPPSEKSVGLVLAGNIPLVGFHDLLCVLVSGNQAQVKLSSQDDKLLPYIMKLLIEIEPGFQGKIKYTDRLNNFDAVIATGSNNTSRYFEHYFGNVPHIIRKNRNSIAVITGTENPEHLSKLGSDIFDYFGLGCRNVSKIYIPANYDLKHFFEGIEGYNDVINHHKYNNNYDYNKSIFLVNGDKHFDNGFLLVKENSGLTSPLATLYFERYTDRRSLLELIEVQLDQIQCIATEDDLGFSRQVSFGGTQAPKLWDYADGINTMQFLKHLAD